MAIVLTGNIESQYPNTPVLNNLDRNNGAQVKGAFIYKNNVITQIYPPIHPVEFTSGNALGCENNATNYIPIGIRFYSSGPSTGMYTVIGGSLPCSVTIKYVYYILTATSYQAPIYTEYTETATISSGSTSGTYCTYKNGCAVTSFSNNQPYILYNNYYIYIVGLAESQYATAPTYRYSYHLIDINWKTKRISYVGNIYSQPNLFNFAYTTSSYSTADIQWWSWKQNTFPQQSNISSTYFRVFPSTFANTVNTSAIATYTANTGKSRLKMYFNVNNDIKIPNIGYTLSNSYTDSLQPSEFGYYFNGYITLNNVIPFTNDPMVPSTGSLFDYNPNTKVSRYKISNLQSNGWTTERKPKVWALDPWWTFQMKPNYSGSTTEIITSFYSPNDNLSTPYDHSSDRFIFIIVSTSPSLTFVVSGADELSNGTKTITASNKFYGTENYGGTSGGAKGYLDTGFDIPLWYSTQYPYQTIGQAYVRFTSARYTNGFLYSGNFKHSNNIISCIYNSVRVELNITNTLMQNNYHYRITGSKANINWFSLYNRSQPLYIYWVGNSNQSTKNITYWAKQVAQVTLDSKEFCWDYIIRNKQW